MTATHPIVLPNRIQQTLEDLSTCLCAEILDYGPPVCFCGVVPGTDVALDYTGDCNDVCGMAWVRLVTSYPSVSIGAPTSRPGNCSAGIGLDVEMGIVRCIDVGDGTQAPPPEELTASAYVQYQDMLTMYRAVSCCRQSKDWVLGNYNPFGPQGGLVGGMLTMSILVL